MGAASWMVAMAGGFVYVLINTAFPGLVKVGKTAKAPEQRAQELSAATGVPTPFVVVYASPFDDIREAEGQVHALLEARGCRLSANREFFHASPTEAIKAVLSVQKQALPAADSTKSAKNVFDAASLAESYFEAAQDAFWGFGDVIQDIDEAIKLYKLAARAGSAEAEVELGTIYAEREGYRDDRLAKEYLRRAGQHGCGSGYARLGQFYAERAELSNAAKAWSAAWTAFTDIEQAGYWGSSYLFCLKCGMEPAHRSKLARHFLGLARIACQYMDSDRARLTWLLLARNERASPAQRGRVTNVNQTSALIRGEGNVIHYLDPKDFLGRWSDLQPGSVVEYESGAWRQPEPAALYAVPVLPGWAYDYQQN